METFSAAKPLARAISASHTCGIIGIDGWTGAGKSTLARSLAEILSGEHYDLDGALNRDRNSYMPSLRLGEISEALAAPAGLLFVSGICLRQVLERVGCAANAHIYVKRMATWGWADEDELDGGSMAGLGSSGGNAVRREMRDYHNAWKPHERGNYEFHRFG